MRKIATLFLILALCTSAVFANAAKEAAPAKADEVIELTVHTVQATSDPSSLGMIKFGEVLEQVSGGKMKAKVYTGAQLFAQDTSLDALRQGMIDVEIMGMAGFEDQIPFMGMFTSAYIFTSWDHAQRFYSSERGQQLYDDIAKKLGMRPLGEYYFGTRELNLRDIGRVVTKPADLKGVKLRMPGGTSWQALGSAIGANPTPLSFGEVYMALKTGTVDGQDNPLPTDMASKFYEVTKYIILTDHLVWNLHPVVNEQKWQSFTDEQKGWVLEAVKAWTDYSTMLVQKQEAELLDYFKTEGMEIITPDKAAFIQNARDFYKANPQLTAKWDMGLYDYIASLAD